MKLKQWKYRIMNEASHQVGTLWRKHDDDVIQGHNKGSVALWAAKARGNLKPPIRPVHMMLVE